MAAQAETVQVYIRQAAIARADVAVAGESFIYTGSPITPAVSVTLKNGTQLMKNRDYTLAYTDNTNAGTATVTVTGTGNYTGTKTATFTIEKATPTPTTPTGLTATYGQTLANVKLPPDGLGTLPILLLAMWERRSLCYLHQGQQRTTTTR